eukprot:GFKZ01006491.1.p1 GENE.GFKZ01006491.1~~GFKZ01006491.1.p1  ORF type:complete len:314 (+),score=44.72 GFKZ01006491.1:180-1121(+)
MAPPRPSPFPYPLLLYLSLHLLLSLHHLYSSLNLRDPHSVARATLSLLSSLSLLPSYHSLRSPHSTPRHAILSLFIISLVALIAAILRLLSALEALSYGGHRLLDLKIVPLQTLLSACCVLALRAAPPIVALRGGGVGLLHRIVATHPIRRRKQTHGQPALLAVLLHAVEGVAVRGLELVAGCAPFATLHAFAVADVLGAVLGMWLALPLLRLSLRVLLQATESRMVAVLKARCDRLMQVEGVLRYVNLHVWEETVGFFVGTVCVVVRKGVETRGVLDMAVKAFDGVVHDLTVQVETCQVDSDSLPDQPKLAH